MKKQTIIERLHEYGVVAAHLNDHNVEFVQGIPRKVTLSLPIFKVRSKFSKGDRIAIVDTDYQTAHICEVSQVELVGVSKKPLLHLKGSKKVSLS